MFKALYTHKIRVYIDDTDKENYLFATGETEGEVLADINRVFNEIYADSPKWKPKSPIDSREKLFAYIEKTGNKTWDAEYYYRGHIADSLYSEEQ